jgi:hypothetical protein
MDHPTFAHRSSRRRFHQFGHHETLRQQVWKDGPVEALMRIKLAPEFLSQFHT